MFLKFSLKKKIINKLMCVDFTTFLLISWILLQPFRTFIELYAHGYHWKNFPLRTFGHGVIAHTHHRFSVYLCSMWRIFYIVDVHLSTKFLILLRNLWIFCFGIHVCVSFWKEMFVCLLCMVYDMRTNTITHQTCSHTYIISEMLFSHTDQKRANNVKA